MKPTHDYYDLGTHSRAVTAASAEVQQWFDRGLMWTYGYNHEEAVVCFKKALALDPGCVMAYWGVAYGLGCNYNRPWKIFSPKLVAKVMKEARQALQQAAAHFEKVTPVEQALCQALEQRFQGEGSHEEEVLCAWNYDYAKAMRKVYQDFPEDWDVATFFVEALINCNPWRLWDLQTRQPAEGAFAEEAIAVIERGLQQVEHAQAPFHPGLLHIYIHVMEMSPHPEKALPAADILRELIPDAGHLKHMPSHIDILCGHYANAIAANDRAIAANNKFLARAGDLNEYTFYRAHDLHFKIYAAMLMGQSHTALEAARDMEVLAHEDLLRVERPPMAFSLEGMVSMKFHVLVRFGKWQEILAEPFPQDKTLYCNTTAMLHYARSIAQATLGNLEAAQAEQEAFQVAQANMDKHRYIFNNTCEDILKIAEAMLQGEVEYHKGNHSVAFEHLRHAVYLDDHLVYAEPWGWMMPTRHALAALLLEQGHVEEAATIYRADLGLDATLARPFQHPENVWSLQGYLDCLEQQGKEEEAAALRPRLRLAQAQADVPIKASCFCATQKQGLSH